MPQYRSNSLLQDVFGEEYNNFFSYFFGVTHSIFLQSATPFRTHYVAAAQIIKDTKRLIFFVYVIGGPQKIIFPLQ